jgi:hypothetical protein
MSTYFTAVFEVRDANAFKALSSQITDSLANESIFHGAVVTAAGEGDSMTEADFMREFLDQRGYDSEQIARGEA